MMKEEEWTITDGEKTYIIRKEKGKLNVCTRSENNGDEKACFITSLDVDEKSANHYGELFRRRWGIETSYRVGDDFKPKTTSTKPTVRLYYFLFSVCVYNLWVIANMILCLILGRIIMDKPLITAKRLIILLQMSMMEKGPP